MFSLIPGLSNAIKLYVATYLLTFFKAMSTKSGQTQQFIST